MASINKNIMKTYLYTNNNMSSTNNLNANDVINSKVNHHNHQHHTGNTIYENLTQDLPSNDSKKLRLKFKRNSPSFKKDSPSTSSTKPIPIKAEVNSSNNLKIKKNFFAQISSYLTSTSHQTNHQHGKRSPHNTERAYSAIDKIDLLPKSHHLSLKNKYNSTTSLNTFEKNDKLKIGNNNLSLSLCLNSINESDSTNDGFNLTTRSLNDDVINNRNYSTESIDFNSSRFDSSNQTNSQLGSSARSLNTTSGTSNFNSVINNYDMNNSVVSNVTICNYSPNNQTKNKKQKKLKHFPKWLNNRTSNSTFNINNLDATINDRPHSSASCSSFAVSYIILQSMIMN